MGNVGSTKHNVGDTQQIVGCTAHNVGHNKLTGWQGPNGGLFMKTSVSRNYFYILGHYEQKNSKLELKSNHWSSLTLPPFLIMYICM